MSICVTYVVGQKTVYVRIQSIQCNIYIYIYVYIYIYTTPRFGIGMIQPHHAWIYTWCHLCFMSYSATADNISSVQPLQKVREYFCNIVITMSDHVSIPIYIYT